MVQPRERVDLQSPALDRAVVNIQGDLDGNRPLLWLPHSHVGRREGARAYAPLKRELVEEDLPLVGKLLGR